MKNIQGNKPLLKINGVSLTPSSAATMVTSQFVDSARNANAKIIAQKINRRQIKYDGIQWNYLTYDEWRQIRLLLENFKANVTYWDEYENRAVTRLFYFGDSSATPFEFDSKNYDVAKPLSYLNCQVNIIDMGY